MAQHVNHINLLTSVDNSSKQMQQTSGSSVSNRPDGDESAVDEVAVDEVAVDEVSVAVVLSFLLMVCSNCDRSFCLVERWRVVFYGVDDVAIDVGFVLGVMWYKMILGHISRDFP